MSTSDEISNNGQEATATAETSNIQPGNFCWWDLGTTDQNAAKAFYCDLLGWTYNDTPMGPDAFYTMFMYDGKTVCACYKQMDDQISQGIPPNWLSYVKVTSADETAAKVAPAGGMLMAPPFDVMDVGRMALMGDPTGAVFGIWEPKTYEGAAHVNAIGGVCWNELVTKDIAAATPFYRDVFGWQDKTEDMGGGMSYTMWKNGESTAGGMMQIDPAWGDVPSNWMPYFTVANCDESAAKTKELGGNVKMGPADIPNVGRFATLQDPQGAHFSIIQLAGPM